MQSCFRKKEVDNADEMMEIEAPLSAAMLEFNRVVPQQECTYENKTQSPRQNIQLLTSGNHNFDDIQRPICNKYSPKSIITIAQRNK